MLKLESELLRRCAKTVLTVALFLCPWPVGAKEVEPARRELTLTEGWQFQRDGADEWRSVVLPASFESHEGPAFDGVGYYTYQTGKLPPRKGGRVLLHFQAAATEAEVSWNTRKLGRHLGGWTPFRFDITEQARRGPGEIEVRLDEKVGHNSQGFLPIIAPHFGGLWQEVKLLFVPDTYFDDLSALVVGNVARQRIEVEVPVLGTPLAKLAEVGARYRERGRTNWAEFKLVPAALGAGGVRDGAFHLTNSILYATIPVATPRLWGPGNPALYEIELTLPEKAGGDVLRARAAFRVIEARGVELRLNGQPLSVRGVLNWGYAAPSTAPSLDEARMRQELEFALARGFNLMKFCLWVPPQRYLDLADELGVLTWMEYPTWHPQLTPTNLATLQREFAEFFHYDRNHPSVILRSLTCETGPGADLGVIRSLYQLAHAMIPGALVEDDSSWIGWNRVHDFYDDHPYGNNHTWVGTLKEFNEYILGHGLKPMVLGEAIAADTWVDLGVFPPTREGTPPWWQPRFLEDQRRWEAQERRLRGSEGVRRLPGDSLDYAMLMRKYQVETFRREMPHAGYVVSVIRDFSTAAMGLISYAGQPKWSAAGWAWQGDTMCLLATEQDRRSFASGETLRAPVLVSHFGRTSLATGEVTAVLTDPAGKECGRQQAGFSGQNRGTLAKVADLALPLPSVTQPIRLTLTVQLACGPKAFTNAWPLWVVPAADTNTPLVWTHSSLSAEKTALLPNAKPWDGQATEGVVVAGRFDPALTRCLESGGRVLLLPDGERSSLPLEEHWFLRGAPYLPKHPLNTTVPQELLVELQHFDLAGPVIPSPAYLDAVDTLLLLWDTHDRREVKTHGLVFETRAGSGRLLVSALRHKGTGNAAGQWLLQVLLRHLAEGPEPTHAFSEALWNGLKQQTDRETVDLVPLVWRFRPDPREQGLPEGWHRPGYQLDANWKDIRIGQHWDSQGYAALDGWAWYRVEVTIPAGWQGREVYLNVEGADDYYEVFVNGAKAGSGGDRQARKTAFEEKKGHRLTGMAKPSDKCTLAIRVEDWQGAGGLFRPITLSTAPFFEGVQILK